MLTKILAAGLFSFIVALAPAAALAHECHHHHHHHHHEMESGAKTDNTGK
jgi:hypothetical protein